MNSFRNNSGWQVLRSVEAVDPQLAANTFDSKPSFAKNINAAVIRGLELILAAIGSENGTSGVRIWGGRNVNSGPAQLIADITFTLGTMVCNKDPQTQKTTDLTRYADSAVVTSYWPTDIKAVNSGNNLMTTVSFDGLDIAWIAVEVISLTNVMKANIYFGYFG
ncbi:MAG: hypothetical protein A2Y10_08565 [Planctomycetes bacterium GWF2_41_51]|nr:MAG: hypothetical protein A2Y10_08565 [Planctomycetes bacterium GWF2_41_51]HBG28586.1 hypothetical protein [Phycisphaerales bacterium]